MWKRKLGLGLSDSFGFSAAEQLRAFAEIGFESFFLDETSAAQCAFLADGAQQLARETGLIFQSIHAPFAGAADMWHADEEKADAAVRALLQCLDDCRRNEVPIMVVHAFIGFEEHQPTARGVERYNRVVRAAEGSGVRIAFENTEGEEYLFALMDAFSGNSAVGFCWDSGHELCYNHSQNLLERFGDRLIATHLNDNLGVRDYNGKTTWIDDLHLLPFDGVIHWAERAMRLKRCGYDGILTFELTRTSKPGRRENNGYARMEPMDYLTQAYQRACRVAAMLECTQ